MQFPTLFKIKYCYYAVNNCNQNKIQLNEILVQIMVKNSPCDILRIYLFIKTMEDEN